MHGGAAVEDDALGPRLVMGRSGDGILEQVRERTVPHVMKERRSERVAEPVATVAAKGSS